MQPPPPIPAITRPRIRQLLEPASPQTKFPMENIKAAITKLALRPKISLSFPLSGCVAVRAMRYPEPSHEIMASDWNSSAMVEDRVDDMVLSGFKS